MELKKTFETAYTPDAVWSGLSDVRLVAGCLPGASIVEELGPDEYKGKLQIKVGPLAASFAGLISIERRPDERVAVVTGKGADAKSSSRVTAKMTYRVQPSATTSGSSQVDIDSDISLAGALAQFGKAAVMQEIANRMTDEFVKRFEAQLAQAHAASAVATAEGAVSASTPATSAMPAASAASAAAVTPPPAATAASATPPPATAASETAATAATPPPSAKPTVAPSAPRPAEPEAFDAGNLLWSILKQRVAAFFRKFFK
jgi:carbon monoxide dehydrogenase subunit G